MKKTLSVRLPKKLHKKVYADKNTNTHVVTKALKQYYKDKEPNQKPFTEPYANANNEKTIEILQDHIDFLHGQVTYLQKENSRLSGGFIHKMKNLLTSKKEKTHK